ncbi:ABC transporter permease [Actinophytocola sp.]|uniref:ABC transporter permease n=1 Tax=Actinophytocola sp. TaxID=1872138 RepID=UPI0025C433DC|nr:ABC transporter permease [Actinophytocola sp.]
MALQRLVSIVPTVLLVLLVTMLLLRLSPTDPAQVYAGVGASPEEITDVRHRLGLDVDLLTRYVHYLVGALSGDLGTSFRTGRPVLDSIASTLTVTGQLVAVAMMMTILVAVPLGLVAALHRGQWIDRCVVAVSSLMVGVPSFVAALVLIALVSVQAGLVPVMGYVSLTDDPVRWFSSLVLPATALALPLAAELIRQLRGSLVGILGEDFIRVQQAKGLLRRQVVGKHAVKNAANPVITVLGLQLSRLIEGAVIVETIFVLPGFGNMTYSAILSHDYPVIQGVVLVSAVLVVFLNMIVDVLCLYFNPRLRSPVGV